jgi:hypothetical protein
VVGGIEEGDEEASCWSLQSLAAGEGQEGAGGRGPTLAPTPPAADWAEEAGQAAAVLRTLVAAASEASRAVCGSSQRQTGGSHWTLAPETLRLRLAVPNLCAQRTMRL